ncbi:Condensin-2 complex subunit H2 [Acorus calamus]|uniref:Condensin-2 complex subunit H2 n=1 Tax=Acorus calamus TaxID=4465 RepID=A0AAV9E5K7_ACOCL|nr:Condensin-2 complex subunit H2 [Acorus calamus]
MDGGERQGSGVGGGGGEGFRILQSSRDLESNWTVDLARHLEEYLLKICSGEIVSDEGIVHHSINFAEAALLLQGSIQVYSRKVEYLYTLVLHALEFLSHKRQEQQESVSDQPDGRDAYAAADDMNEKFLEDAKNCLANGFHKDDCLHQIVRPPANMLVLEGDCLDTSGDAGELESYLLATSDLYQDFLLLDPCDAGAVYDFLKSSISKEQCGAVRGSSVKSKTRKSVQSPTGRSGGAEQKFSNEKNKNIDLNQNSEVDCTAEIDNTEWPSPHIDNDSHDDDMYHREEQNGSCSKDMENSDDDDDPWKPLNPHEPGSLKVKPYKKGKAYKKLINPMRNATAIRFPLASPSDCIINPEFIEIAETLKERLHERKGYGASAHPSLFEKLRQSVDFGVNVKCGNLGVPEDKNVDIGIENDFHDSDNDDTDLLHCTNMETEVPLHHEMQRDEAAYFDSSEAFVDNDLNSHTNLEDLCRSHLDSLLASIAETEKQTELAQRVSTWKQRIETVLEEQDARPSFDIHLYGERILEKLSTEADGECSMSFLDVVAGQEKHEVARAFSALLQLVNNGDVGLDKGNIGKEPICYTSSRPFYVQLQSRDKKRENVKPCPLKKRVNSPLKKDWSKDYVSENLPRPPPSLLQCISPGKTSPTNSKFSVKIGKTGVTRCTPESKRRRRSRLIAVNLQHAR